VNKDFSDFMESMESKDWSLAAEQIYERITAVDAKDPHTLESLVSNIIKAEITTMLTILREYHDWVSS
jgi:hypothetical protein